MSLFVYPRSVASWKLLVVDDDPDIRRIAALSLGRLGGFQVALASCAEEALAEVTNNRPDLVLLDVTMPGTDGPATLAAIHALPGSETLPVVFFTATSSDVEVARLRSLGAIGVLPKPFEVAELPKRIRAIAAEAGLGWNQ
jgi:CheY-like chemotaxis protein